MEKAKLDEIVKDVEDLAEMVVSDNYKKSVTSELARTTLGAIKEIIDVTLKPDKE